MAEMYGEVMDLNSELHKRIQEQEKDIRQLRTKLLQVCWASCTRHQSVCPMASPQPLASSQSTPKSKPKGKASEEKW